jgi:hypothetical protein
MAATEMSKNHVLACRSDPAGPMWTKIGTVKRLNPRNKPIKRFLKMCKFDLTWRGQTSKFDLILSRNHVLACCSDLDGPMWTKIGTVKRLDHRNKPVKVFFF